MDTLVFLRVLWHKLNFDDKSFEFWRSFKNQQISPSLQKAADRETPSKQPLLLSTTKLFESILRHLWPQKNFFSFSFIGGGNSFFLVGERKSKLIFNQEPLWCIFLTGVVKSENSELHLFAILAQNFLFQAVPKVEDQASILCKVYSLYLQICECESFSK